MYRRTAAPMGKTKQGKKGPKKGGAEKRGDVDAFENPVAQCTFEDETDAVEASAANTFEDDSRPTHLARADVVADAGASIFTDADPDNKGCCLWLLVPTLATKGDGSTSAPSIVQFDAMQLMDRESLDPQLHDHAGKLVSFAHPKGLKVTKKNLAKPTSIDGDDEEEEQSVAALLEEELAELQKQIKKRHEWEEGRPVSIQRKEENRRLMEQVKQAEARLKKEKARFHQKNEAALAAADLVAQSKATQRHTTSAQANVFTIDEHGPLGIDWNYQNGRPVIAAIRDGGCAENHGLRIGMVLSQYRQPRLGQKSSVGYDQVRREAEKRTTQRGEEISPGRVAEYLSVRLELVERPLQLVFKTPGTNLQRALPLGSTSYNYVHQSYRVAACRCRQGGRRRRTGASLRGAQYRLQDRGSAVCSPEQWVSTWWRLLQE